ncbi:hypothetical protein E6O75_ATG08587 [Venturia nashicola]|uniref:Uncharacterized protein n=1 Tax=Venturia nashicola TaxID=86259 RepID=A0A4Z1NMN4_9PEZI|nr:hypothetical protein E6O75_ATG08587 [Venturia nashicola]
MTYGTATASTISKPAPTSFLDLPPHIRTQIYTYLICHTPLDSAPTLQQFHQNDPYQRLFRHSASIAEAKIERLIHYPSRIYLAFEGLLRTNRTIRSEVKKVLTGLRKKHVTCKLDLIIERGRDGGGGVWPSWLICPARNPLVRRLEMDVRVFGDDFEIHGTGSGRGGPVVLRQFESGALGFEHAHVGRERCRTLAFAVVATIARFIERGARWGHVRGEVGVETLVLNFVDVGIPPGERREERKNKTRDENKNEKEREMFLELTPPTPPDDCPTCAAEDYWDIDALVGSADEALTFALGDGKISRPTSTDEDESIQAPELLRMVDLVLKPLCREERYMLHRRKHHFSAVHLALIRRNVKRVVIELKGRLKRRMKVVDL